MKAWPRHPVTCEIATWVWLGELTWKHGGVVDLGTVPAQEWDSLAAPGFDAARFMGVWERSPAAQRQSDLPAARRSLAGRGLRLGRALPGV